MPVIELRDVTRRFGTLTAVDQVSLDVDEGEIVGMLGHNGAGKTTLLRVINGLLEPNAGQVRVTGLDPVRDGATVRRRTGVLTEYPALDEYLTTRENLQVYAAINGLDPEVARQRIALLLQRLGLWEKRDTVTRGLSAGLKQRVALARGLVHDPEILLLDEPTTNMDPVAAREVRTLIKEAVRELGRTVLLSTHNLVEAEDLCDRVGIMRHGELLAIGRPADLRRELGSATGLRVTTAPGDLPRLQGALPPSAQVRLLDEHTAEITGGIAVPEAVALLVRAGVEVHRVDPIEPTLEDLYVALHHEEVMA